jgi:hypothetical protein
MPAATPPEVELTKLNQEIERLEVELAMLEEQRKKRWSAARRAVWRGRYLHAARTLRRPTARWDWWPIGVLILGPTFVAIVFLTIASAVSSWTSLALFALFVGAAAGMGALASLLYRPRDDQLPSAIDEAGTDQRVTLAHWKETFDRLAEVKQQHARLVEDRRQRMASGRVQRAALLQRPWRQMPAAEWEDFVVEVCRTLGATVNRRSRGDEGAELIVAFGDHQVAALIKTSDETIHSGTVQHALAMKDREQCALCAIITNGRFTGAAQDYAERIGCKLIGRGEFPDFVLGTITL